MGRPKPVPAAREPLDGTALGRAYRKVTGSAGNAYAAGSRSPRTWRQYASAVKLFEEWCAEMGLQAMPANVETLIRYIVHLADEGYAYASIMTALNGLGAWHDSAGHPLDRRPLHPTLKGIKRTAPRSTPAEALVVEDLRRILAVLDPAKLRDVRDGALLAVTFAGALRPSEAVGLDWKRHGGGTGTLKLTPRGIAIVLHTSKTSPLADQAVPPIPAADMPVTIEWLRRWLELAAIEPGSALFRLLDADDRLLKRRMASSAVTSIVRRRVEQLAVAQGASRPKAMRRALPYSGHSMRHGLGTSEARAGVPEWRIRHRMRHRKAESTGRYIQAVEKWDDTGLKAVRL